MRNLIKKVSTLLVIAMLLVVFSCIVSASNGLDNKYSNIAIEYLASGQGLPNQTKNINLLHENMQKALKSEAAENQIYPDYYGGSYVNEKNEYVVLLTDNTKTCQEHIHNLYGSTKLIILPALHSYNELYELKNVVTNRIVELKNNVILSIQLDTLLNSYVGVGIDEENNELFVDIIDVTNEKIELFKEHICDSELIVFNECKDELEDASIATIYPGGCVMVKNKGEWFNMSVGFRAKKLNTNGTYSFGFVTAGHGADIGDDVCYYIQSTASAYYLGTVMNSQVSGSVDAAFIAIDINNYPISTFAFYTDKNGGTSGTRDEISTTHYFIAAAQGTTVIKNGITTYRTEGKVITTSYDYISSTTGNTITDAVKADYVSDHGDSGGIVYGKSGGSVDYLVAGIESAFYKGFLGIGSYSVYIKVSNIKEAFNLYIY